MALIGSGRMGSFHGETLARRLPGAELAAVADPAPGAAEKLAASLGAPKFTTDPAEVFADPDIDAVVIAAPARFHADLVVAAAAAGKGVFCEKPMAFTLADADRAIDARTAAGVVLQVGFNRRYAPDWAAARGPAGRRPAGHAAAAALGHPGSGRFRPGAGCAEHDLHWRP